MTTQILKIVTKNAEYVSSEELVNLTNNSFLDIMEEF